MALWQLDCGAAGCLGGVEVPRWSVDPVSVFSLPLWCVGQLGRRGRKTHIRMVDKEKLSKENTLALRKKHIG